MIFSIMHPFSFFFTDVCNLPFLCSMMLGLLFPFFFFFFFFILLLMYPSVFCFVPLFFLSSFQYFPSLFFCVLKVQFSFSSDFCFPFFFRDHVPSVFSSSSSSSQGQIGTPRYMPPEVFYRQRYDPRIADMYTLGIVLFISVRQSSVFFSLFHFLTLCLMSFLLLLLFQFLRRHQFLHYDYFFLLFEYQSSCLSSLSAPLFLFILFLL